MFAVFGTNQGRREAITEATDRLVSTEFNRSDGFQVDENRMDVNHISGKSVLVNTYNLRGSSFCEETNLLVITLRSVVNFEKREKIAWRRPKREVQSV